LQAPQASASMVKAIRRHRDATVRVDRGLK
jgi:hypothetical protein